MARPLSARDAGAPFTSWQYRRSRGRQSSESTCESRPAVGAPLSDFEVIAGRYPVYRIDPHESDLLR